MIKLNTLIDPNRTITRQNITLNNQPVSIYNLVTTESLTTIIQEVIDITIKFSDFRNHLIEKIATDLGIVKLYTDIEVDLSITTLFEDYDILSPYVQEIIQFISKDQLELYYSSISETLSSIYYHRNSVMGLFDLIEQKEAGALLKTDEILAKYEKMSNSEILKSIIEDQKSKGVTNE